MEIQHRVLWKTQADLSGKYTVFIVITFVMENVAICFLLKMWYPPKSQGHITITGGRPSKSYMTTILLMFSERYVSINVHKDIKSSMFT
jgi:hypothetical protein